MPVIIDGHNLIGRMSGISLAEPDDEEKLIRALAQHLHFRREKITVVFDKAAVADEGPRFETRWLHVIFAPQGKTADDIIMDMIKKDPNPKGLIIVSSDNEIRRCAKSRRARIISAEEYARKLEAPVPRHQTGKDGADMDEFDVEEWLQYFRRRRK